MKQSKPTLDQQEQATLADLWARIVMDPDAHPDDVERARKNLSRPPDTTVLGNYAESAPPWKLKAIQVLMAEKEFAPELMGLQHRIRDLVMKAK